MPSAVLKGEAITLPEIFRRRQLERRIACWQLMCGICGFWTEDNRERGEWHGILDRMADVLAHRGPDDRGCVLKAEGERIVGLGHRRLSVIDLSAAGHQPMFDASGELSLVFNGEIYNFPELRRDLEEKGCTFVGRSDTEVIIHAYREYGLDVFQKLDGMFSLALWDGRARRLLLARDPFGKKPLFYYRKNNQWVFASELKSILKNPVVTRHLDRRALETYLFLGYLPAPQSILQDVYKVKPGHYLCIEGDDCREVPYWKISFQSDLDIHSMEEEQERFLELLERAVSKRLVSDVPLGVLLSGGIDSTAVAYFVRKISRDPIETFTMGFREEAFNELPYALQASEFLGMKNVNMVAGPEELTRTVASLPDVADEPLADSSIIPYILLSQMARKRVTVALGGDGVDELLAGYPTYPLHRFMNIYDSLPGAIRRAAGGVVNLMPPTFGNYNFEYGLKKFMSGSGHPPEIRHFMWMSYFPPEELGRVLESRSLPDEELFEGIRETLAESDAESDEEKAFYLNLRMYLPGSILTKVDRASMSSSLEVRAPFLDKALAEYLIALPAGMKMEGLRGKKLFRRSMKGVLPDRIIRRPKKGFTPPMARWINHELRSTVDDFLCPDSIRRSGQFSPDGVTGTLEEHRRGKRNNWRQIWALLVFQMWHRRYMEGGSAGNG